MEKKNYRINIHAGHNPSGKISCGAVGILDESKEARNVVKRVIQLLQEAGITVYDCTCNNGTNQTDILKRIVQKCNAHEVNLDISIHFNSGRGDGKGDGKIGGTEVWMRTAEGIKQKVGRKICKKMEQIGFTNRGIKMTKSLYFLNHTKAPAVLVEVCFVDDKDDAELYKKSKKVIAKAITNAILNSLG